MDGIKMSGTSTVRSSPRTVIGLYNNIPALITISHDRSCDITLWDAELGNTQLQPLGTLSGHRSAVTHLCVSKDSEWLFSASQDSWLLWQLDFCLDRAPYTGPHQLKGPDPSHPLMRSLVVSCFSPCNSHLFVSTGTRISCIEVPSGVGSEVNLDLVSLEGSGWSITCATFCSSVCIAIGLEDRSFRICDIVNNTLIYQSSVFPASFTCIDCATSNGYLVTGSTDGTVKLFSVFGLIEKSCDRVLHEISLSCDQQSYDRNDVEHSDSSVISISVLEGKETGLQNRDFLVLAVKSNGLTIVNGFTRDVIGEFNTNDPVPSLAQPLKPTVTLPLIHHASFVQIGDNELLCSLSGLFDKSISLFKITILDQCHPETTELISALSSSPLVSGSVLQTEPLVPRVQTKANPKLSTCQRYGNKRGIRDQPLTFKSKIKSSGYTQQPRMTMFTPCTNSKPRQSFGTRKKPSGGGKPPRTALDDSQFPLYDDMSLRHSLALPGNHSVTHSMFTGDGSNFLYAVNKTLYMMKPLPSPTPLDRHVSMNGHDGDILDISCSHDNKWVLTCSADRTAKVWRVNPCAQQPVMHITSTVHNYKETSSSALTRDNRPFPDSIGHCGFYYLDQFILLSCGGDISLFKYHLDTERPDDIKRYLTKSHYKRVLLFTPDSTPKSITSLSCINDFYSYLVYSAGSDRSLHVYDMNAMKWVWSVDNAHKRAVHCISQNKGSKFVSCSPPESHDLFVTSSVGDGIKLWDTRTQRCTRWYTSHTNRSQPVSTCFSPCGRYIATGSEDKMAYVYDIRQLAPVDKLVCKTSVVSTVQYHPSRPLIICGTLEGELNFFETGASVVKNQTRK